MPNNTPSSVASEISAVFAAHVDAFARKDAAALSELWDEVGLFPSPTGNFLMERRAFRDHCVKLMEFYQRQGVATPVGDLISVDVLFPNVAQARMEYRMLDGVGELVAGWEHVYILRKTDRWRVSLTIADDEMAAWAKKGAQF